MIVKEINVENLTDGRRIFTVKENYSDVSVPSHFLSHGTVNIIALIVVMFFEKEKNIIN